MKILLLQDVRGLGRKYEIKNVSDGYARNFLISKKLAVPADEKAMKMKGEFDAQNQKTIQEYQDMVRKLTDETLELSVKTGARGEVFGSVTAADITNVLRAKGFADGEAVLSKPLRTLGEHRVEVRFGKGVKGEVLVILKPAV